MRPSLRRLVEWLKSTPARFDGSLVPESNLSPTRLSTRAEFPLSAELYAKYREKGIEIEKQPDTFVASQPFVDFEDLPA